MENFARKPCAHRGFTLLHRSNTNRRVKRGIGEEIEIGDIRICVHHRSTGDDLELAACRLLPTSLACVAHFDS